VQEVCQVVEALPENVPIYMESSIDASACYIKQVSRAKKAIQQPTIPAPKRMSLRQRNMLCDIQDPPPPSETEK
jgi:hypothetical protein